jgi:Uma2 family endonuclease
MQTETDIPIRGPPLRLYTIDEYDRMARDGFFGHQRVELVEGRIIVMAAQYEPHVAGVSLAARAAERAFGPGYWVRRQNPVRLGKYSNPEPDVAVVAGSEADYIDSGAPHNPVLIIEVSDSTLKYDRGRKAAMYAKSGVADYWILNIVDRQLEVHRDPIADAAHQFKFRYSDITVLRVDDVISPLAAQQTRIAVAEIMPRPPHDPAAVSRPDDAAGPV